MKSFRYVVASTIASSAVALTVYAQGATFGGDKIKFPSDLGMLYAKIDRADNKQFREYYASPAAVDAAKKGQPLPPGTVLTGVLFKAKLDDKGEPSKGADGRFIKDDLIGYIVMEKQAGWGASIPAELRNGEWEYQAFTAAKAVNDKANLKACYECHRDKAGSSKEFVFTREAIGK